MNEFIGVKQSTSKGFKTMLFNKGSGDGNLMLRGVPGEAS